MGVGPDSLAIAVEARPVGFPCRGAYFGLFDVVVALAVAGEVEELISCCGG